MTKSVFYHVDRNKSLSEGLVIEALHHIPSLDESLVLLCCELFPDGVSKHGADYLTGLQPATMWFWELVLEFVRRTEFPNRISRMVALFAFERVQDCASLPPASGSTGSVHRIWEVEGASRLRADMQWLEDARPGIAGGLQAARGYWTGSPKGESPLWEHLLIPPVRVGREVSP